jgi:hypothetical protein
MIGGDGRPVLEFGGEIGGPVMKDRLWFWGPVSNAPVLPLMQMTVGTMTAGMSEIRVPGALGRTVGRAGPAPRQTPGVWLAAVRRLWYRLMPVAAALNRDARVDTAIGRPMAAAPRLELQAQPSAGGGAGFPVKVYLTSLGRSSGEAFRMVVANESPAPVKITGSAFVLEPVARVTEAELEGALNALDRVSTTTVTIDAYCLEYAKAPPTAGTIFRLAPAAVQDRFGWTRQIFDATRKLADAKQLVADVGELKDYVDAIRQWALWTREEKYDERGFGEAFVDHARKNVEAGGTRWTREIETAFRGLVPGRWRAVQLVLRTARLPV